MMPVIIICLILVFIIIFLLLSNYIFLHTQHYKSIIEETEKLKYNKKVDIVNTGSTFAFYGLDYQYVNRNGINLALKPQSLEKDFKMLKHFSYLYNDRTVVLICISDLAFSVAKYTNKETDYKYYRILKKKEINGYSFINAMKVKYFPVTLHWKNFLRFLRDVPRSTDYDIAVNENDIEAIKADALMRSKKWCSEFDLKDLTNSQAHENYIDIFEVTTGIVKSMIEWCVNKGLSPVLVNLPMSNEMNENFSEDFISTFYYKNILKSNEKKIPFIDFNKNLRLRDYLLYIDSVRLNRAGREVVTKLLIKELMEMGYYNE